MCFRREIPIRCCSLSSSVLNLGLGGLALRTSLILSGMSYTSCSHTTPENVLFLTLRNCLSSLLDFGAKKRLLRKIPTLQPLISLFKDFLRADLAHQQELVHPSLEFKALLVAQREASMQLVFFQIPLIVTGNYWLIEVVPIPIPVWLSYDCFLLGTL